MESADEVENLVKPKRQRKLRKNTALDSEEGPDIQTATVEASESTRADVPEVAKKPAAPGKKRVKVKRTRTYTDKDGYMVTSDYSSYEE